MSEETRKKIDKLQAELQAKVDRSNRIDELRKEIESYGYVIEKHEVKEARENLSSAITSCVFWIGVIIALPLIGSGIGFYLMNTSGALAGAGIGALVAIISILVMHKLEKKKNQ